MHFITSCESDQALNKLQLQNKGAMQLESFHIHPSNSPIKLTHILL